MRLIDKEELIQNQKISVSYLVQKRKLDKVLVVNNPPQKRLSIVTCKSNSRNVSPWNVKDDALSDVSIGDMLDHNPTVVPAVHVQVDCEGVIHQTVTGGNPALENIILNSVIPVMQRRLPTGGQH